MTNHEVPFQFDLAMIVIKIPKGFCKFQYTNLCYSILLWQIYHLLISGYRAPPSQQVNNDSPLESFLLEE